MVEIINSLIDVYLQLYRISLIVSMLFLWNALSHIDRVHMREKTRYVGSIVSRCLSFITINNSVYDGLRLILIRPICVILDTVAGFIEGLEGLEAIFLISENYQNNLR